MSSGRDRKLRSKDENATSLLFNFDKANKLVYRNEPIAVVPEVRYNNLYKSFEDPQLPDKSKTSKQSNVEVINELLPRRIKVKTDPLDDSVYTAFNKRMKKEEKSMTTADRLKIMSEIDNLKNQLNLLQQTDWHRHLPKITYINDLKDARELEQKRKLTILEIHRLLEKYDDWKLRHEKLLHDIKVFESNPVPLFESESILSMPLAELKEQRRRERVKEHGPTVVLKLGNGLEIILSPYTGPRVVQEGSSKSPSPERKKQT